MIKKLILPFVLFFALGATAQQLNNSWIDYSKTYYKFKLAEDNIYRIPQTAIAAVGLSATNADHFQLWRNGVQIRLFTPITAAPLGATDYIEFYGEMNDGKADKQLYRQPQFQLADRYSLETDTAAYFLTVNPGSVNLRYADLINPNPASGQVADAYFLRRIDLFYRNQYCRGFGVDFSEYVHSSSYDNGEGPVSATISAPPPPVSGTDNSTTIFTETINGLNVYYGGPQNGLSIRTKVYFNTSGSYRSLSLKVFNNTVSPTLPSSNPNMITNGLNSLNVIANNLPTSYLTNAANMDLSFVLKNSNAPNAVPPAPIDNMVISTIGITYPSKFNFNNTKSFAFDLGASPTGNYIIIDNFNFGTVAPVLYDLNNGRRYTGDIVSTPGKVKFVLPASSDITRKFILNNVETANIKVVNTLTTKNFVDYNTAANKGDYIIISHPKMYNDGSGVNNVELYRAYRNTANGGGYNAKITDINELTDQFAFGIKSHPSAIRDYIRYMDANYTVKPKAVFLIGRGISYYDKKLLELNPMTYPTNAPILEKLDFIPTFGWPASDILLTSNPGTTTPITPIGRLGAINGTEVGYYYQKILQYEANQRLQSPLISDKAWMKNTMQIVGGRTPGEVQTFEYYMNGYKNWIEDTLFGGHVNRFSKTTSATIQQASSSQITQDFADGLGFIKYFGHSSSTGFEFNLSDPNIYNNTGKYPFFSVSGCTAGNYYNFDPNRLTILGNLSEKYVLANQKGSIAFLADTHFGLPGYLNYWNDRFHENFCRIAYGQTVGSQIKDVINTLGGNNSSLDYNTRIHIEEINLHGDPVLKINNFPKPDYVIEPQLVKITPSIISVSDQFFNVKAIWRNIGKATNDSINVIVKRTLANNTIEILKDTTIFATKYMDSLEFMVPINPIKDKGNNRICVELDNTNRVDEIYETNNKTCSDFFIFEATLAPVYPYNYAIVNSQNITYAASTANPLLPVTSNYVMEIDTTALFNSPFKKAYNKTGLGGLIEFTPTNITFTDSTVYYWRTAVIPASGNTIWNTTSFVYLPNSSFGYNQSHYFQHQNSEFSPQIILQPNRKLAFTGRLSNLSIKNGVFPSAANQAEDFQINIDGFTANESVCGISGIIISAFNPSQMEAIPNNQTVGGSGLYGSGNICGPTRALQFQYNILTLAGRNAARDFLDQIPNGYYVVARNISGTAFASNTYALDWQADGANSLYFRLKNAGFNDIDSFNRPRAFNFIYKKNDNAFTPLSKFSSGINDKIQLDAICPSRNYFGTITSPLFGPARSWSNFKWSGYPQETTAGDSVSFEIIGVNNIGTETTLYTVDSTTKNLNISSINAVQYPYLKLKMFTKDKVTATPYQLNYWRLNYTPVPEGAIAPSLLYSMKDTVEAGEQIKFTLAFKNISKVNFSDSMKIGLTIRTNNNFDSVIVLPKGKILAVGDTLKATYTIPSENFIGNNTLILDFNPNNDQLEQFHFNNLLYKNFYVRGDEIHPLLDVTFDGVHILNRDIVSAKPNILIKLKDENRFLALKDTGLLKVQLKYPGENTYRNISLANIFTPASFANGENTATINLKPFLNKDGDYELVVSGRDVTGNDAGTLSYRSTFTVLNKPMISEMLNYPNPFTTSTAFVFTLTGSEVPQNLRIQILTISGKIVKEITKAELGNIHIGRNITDYKWDGTDSYNQPLGNGVYLYRVITNLNGKSLDKYKAEGDDTGKYFNKGYGKMYLMR